MIDDKIKSNSWINPISNHHKITIFNVLVVQTDKQSLILIKRMIKKGLSWFITKYKMNITVIEEN